MVEFDRWESFGFASRLLINVQKSFALLFESMHPQKFDIVQPFWEQLILCSVLKCHHYFFIVYFDWGY